MMQEDRSLLASIAGAAAAGITLAGCTKRHGSDADESGEGNVTAKEDLMREHGILRRILIVYREVAPKLVSNAAAVDATALLSAGKLFQTFGERYHEQLLEEGHIFPIIRKSEGAEFFNTIGRKATLAFWYFHGVPWRTHVDEEAVLVIS
jgi:hypothetical protein